MKKITITKRALIQRINRKLKTKGQVLKTGRDGRSWTTTGDHYAVDLQSSVIVATHIGLEEEAKELGVLAGYEKVEA